MFICGFSSLCSEISFSLQSLLKTLKPVCISCHRGPTDVLLKAYQTSGSLQQEATAKLSRPIDICQVAVQTPDSGQLSPLQKPLGSRCLRRPPRTDSSSQRGKHSAWCGVAPPVKRTPGRPAGRKGRRRTKQRQRCRFSRRGLSSRVF